MTASSPGGLPDLPRVPVEWRWAGLLVLFTGAATWWAYHTVYPLIPDPMPVHWNAAGDADGFRDKSVQNFLVHMLLGPGIVLVTLLGAQGLMSLQSGHITERGSGVTDAGQARRIWHGLQAMMRSVGWYLFGLSALLTVSAAASQHPGLPGVFPLTLLGIVLLTGAVIWHGVRTRRSLEERFPPPEEEKAKRWGIFYNDPDDKRVFVPAPDSLGGNITTNVGHRTGQVVTLALCGAPLVIVAALVIASL